jgi:hypothetical protein
MPLEATVQGAPAEIGNGIPQSAQHVVQRQQRVLAERHRVWLPRPASTPCSSEPSVRSV